MSDCWEYDGLLTDQGYGRAVYEGRSTRTHIVAYRILVGDVTDGLELDHLCNNRRCYNPLHLEPVTHAENLRRGAERRTHCRAGHPWTMENTRQRAGYRKCRMCEAQRAREYRQRRKRERT